MKARHYILIGILLLGLGLRLIRLSWPAAPVFDEAHFATYAADYVKNQVFYDIHPPLGKLIYAATLYVATGGDLSGATDFVAFHTTTRPGSVSESTPAATGTSASAGASTTSSVVYATGIPYGSYPYVPLRAVSVAFGLFLIFAFYWFLRSAGVGETGALLGALFAAVDNALVLQTKLILMDGMYLAFGFAALALYFRRPRLPVAAGVVFALSLGVKLIGIVFLAPILVEYYFLFNAAERKSGGRNRLVQFFVSGGVTFAAIALLNFVFFSPSRILAFTSSLGTRIPSVAAPAGRWLLASFMSTAFPWISGYLQNGTGPYASPWYFWPTMQIPMYYYNVQLALVGDPVLWIGSSVAVAFAIALFVRYVRRRFFLKNGEERGSRALILLLGGYVGALLPFFTIVHRETFLYHYFPALLFAFGLLALLLSRWLGFGDIGALSRRQRFFLLMIVVLVGCGFLAVAPFTYGL